VVDNNRTAAPQKWGETYRLRRPRDGHAPLPLLRRLRAIAGIAATGRTEPRQVSSDSVREGNGDAQMCAAED